ncbi:MAG: hypothetical protein JST53_03805 [Actinobacteria bacterium]|nr:hypothetical protein [Actinomycetota bacterium]
MIAPAQHLARSAMRLALAILVVALAAATSGATAFAAGPIGLGPGETSPHLAVGNGGVGYLTWAIANGGATEEVHYCRLDPGATACSEAKNLALVSGFESDAGNAPLVAPGRVLILAGRYGTADPGGENFLYSSADGFASHQVVAKPAKRFTDAAFAPAGTVAPQERLATVDSGPVTGGGFFQASGTSALESANTSFDLATADTVSEAVVAQGTTFYAAYVDLTTHEVFWRHYVGSGGAVAGLDKATEWSAAAPIAPGGENVALAGGPGGLFVAYDSPDGTVMLQKFNGVGWEAPVALTGTGVPNGWFALSEDGAGVLHLAWEDATGALRNRYARDASNTSFTNPQTLATGGGFRDLELGVEPSGLGWVTWQDFNASPFVDEAMPVAPGEPAEPAQNPTASPTPTPAPPKARTPPEYKGPSKTTGKSLGNGLEGTLGTPKQCVAGGAYFKARVAVKRKGSRAHKASYSVPKVKFFLGGKLVATDTKKPFEARLGTTGAAAGSTIAVAARISVSLRKGHRHSTVEKSLTATVKTCP